MQQPDTTTTIIGDLWNSRLHGSNHFWLSYNGGEYIDEAARKRVYNKEFMAKLNDIFPPFARCVSASYFTGFDGANTVQLHTLPTADEIERARSLFAASNALCSRNGCWDFAIETGSPAIAATNVYRLW